MPKKRFSAEQVVTLLHQIEVSIAQGKSAPVACREAGISQQSYYRWRKEYGGLEIDQARRMKDLERENVRLKRLVADPKRRFVTTNCRSEKPARSPPRSQCCAR
jgi:putative transposase